MKRHRRSIVIAFIILFTLVNGGCWDREELENLALIIALGIDGQAGERVEVTAQVAIPARLAGAAGGGEGPPVAVVTKSAMSVPEALKAINRVVNRRVSLAQNSVIIFGEESARKGLTRYMSLFARYREFRRTMQIVVVKGRAREVMNLEPEIEKNPAEYLLDLVHTARYTSESEIVTVNDFIRAMEGYGAAPIATYLLPPKKGGPAKLIQLGGVAVFRGDKMVGVLPSHEVPALLTLTNRFSENFFSMADPTTPGRRIILHVTSTRARIVPILRGDKAALKVQIKTEIDLTGSETGKDYLSNGNEGRIEGATARVMVRQLRQVIARTQRELKADPFGFGNSFRAKMPTWSRWVAFNWAKRFPTTPVDLKVSVFLRRYGLQREAPIPHF